MKKNLTWWDLIWFEISTVIGAGIFVLTGQEAKEEAGPAVVLSFVVSGVSAMLSVFCCTEFAVEIPVAGSLPSALMEVAKSALSRASANHDSVSIRAENKSYSYVQLVSSVCEVSSLLCSEGLKSEELQRLVVQQI